MVPRHRSPRRTIHPQSRRVPRLGAVLLVVAACLVPGAAGAAGPSVEVGAAGDPRRGHVVVSVRIHDLDADVTTMRVEMFGAGGYDAAYNVTCPRVTDADDPSLTHRCEVPMPEITTPGTYRVILTRALATQQVLEVDVAPFAHEWWTDVASSFDVDPDDGTTDARLAFGSVPPAELPLDVVARSEAGTTPLPCTPTEAPEGQDVEVVCTSDNPLPPLCVDDAFDAATCAADQHRYRFEAAGHDTGVVHEAVFQEVTEYAAGHAAGTADQRAGRDLTGVDLDSFVLTSSDGCRVANLPRCRENGYYTGWTQALVEDWPRAVRYLDVVRDGDRAVVSAAVSTLPEGAHGLHLELAHWPADDPADVSTVVCGGSCTDVAVTGLPTGPRVFALRVVDDHPSVTVSTYDGDTSTRGDGVLVELVGDPVPDHQPSAHADLTVDDDLVGRLVVELWDLPAVPGPRQVQLSLDAVDDGLGWLSEVVDCTAVDDADRPRVSLRCEATIDPAPPSGAYVVTAALGGTTLTDDVDLVVADGWWDAPRLVSSTTDPFTGQTDLVVAFPDAPADVGVDHLELWEDREGYGTPTRRTGTVDCADDDGVLTCAIENLDPLCTSGPFASACSGAETHLLVHRGRVVPLPITASFTQPSRYEEGVFFAHDGFASGLDYAVDDLVLESSAVCTESDATHCYDAGFYTTWLGLLRDRLSGPSFADAVQLQVGGGSATVQVPRVPQATGAHGVSLHLRHTTPSGVVTTSDVDCSDEACAAVVLDGLEPGEHEIDLVAENHHPRVVVTTLDGTEVEWGDDALVDRPLASFVVDGDGPGPDPDPDPDPDDGRTGPDRPSTVGSGSALPDTGAAPVGVLLLTGAAATVASAFLLSRRPAPAAGRHARSVPARPRRTAPRPARTSSRPSGPGRRPGSA